MFPVLICRLTSHMLSSLLSSKAFQMKSCRLIAERQLRMLSDSSVIPETRGFADVTIGNCNPAHQVGSD